MVGCSGIVAGGAGRCDKGVWWVSGGVESFLGGGGQLFLVRLAEEGCVGISLTDGKLG